jgi:hypothetical protein
MTDKIEKEDNDNECWEETPMLSRGVVELVLESLCNLQCFQSAHAFFWPTLGAQIEARMILEL